MKLIIILVMFPALAFAQYSPVYQGTVDTFIVRQHQEVTFEYQTKDLRIWFRKTRDSVLVGAAGVVYYRESIAKPESLWRASAYYRLMGRGIFPK
jgi:hypothetical protein